MGNTNMMLCICNQYSMCQEQFPTHLSMPIGHLLGIYKFMLSSISKYPLYALYTFSRSLFMRRMQMKKSFGPKTLIYPTPVWLIGTYDKEGKPNAMTVAWCGVCSSQPPCVAVSIRKATYTHGNIVNRKAFTVNVPSASYVKQADYFGLFSGKSMDKFSATGLTAVKGDKVDAPYIKEFPMILECRLISSSEIGIHTQFIGQIIDAKADESVLGNNGLPDLSKVAPILYAPETRIYYGVGARLGQAHSIGKEI